LKADAAYVTAFFNVQKVDISIDPVVISAQRNLNSGVVTPSFKALLKRINGDVGMNKALGGDLLSALVVAYALKASFLYPKRLRPFALP
jgi:hypothetical protein